MGKILTAKEAMAVPGARKCSYGEFQRRRMMTGAVKPKFIGEYLDEHGGRTAAVKRADGRYSQLTEAIWEDIEAAQTGGSYFLDGSSPTSGYTVGGYHGERRRAEELIVMPQEQLDGDELGHENIDAAIELMVEEYVSVVGSASDAVVGWWLDVSSGYVYFDISQIYYDIDEAMDAAVDGMEEAIFDLGNGIEIPVWSAEMEKYSKVVVTSIVGVPTEDADLAWQGPGEYIVWFGDECECFDITDKKELVWVLEQNPTYSSVELTWGSDFDISQPVEGKKSQGAVDPDSMSPQELFDTARRGLVRSLMTYDIDDDVLWDAIAIAPEFWYGRGNYKWRIDGSPRGNYFYSVLDVICVSYKILLNGEFPDFQYSE